MRAMRGEKTCNEGRGEIESEMRVVEKSLK
jgi:hypothetical protein